VLKVSFSLTDDVAFQVKRIKSDIL